MDDQSSGEIHTNFSPRVLCYIQIELKRLHPQGQLWKGFDPLVDVVIQGVRVNILARTISRILHGPEFLPPSKSTEFDHRVEEMQKVKVK